MNHVEDILNVGSREELRAGTIAQSSREASFPWNAVPVTHCAGVESVIYMYKCLPNQL